MLRNHKNSVSTLWKAERFSSLLICMLSLYIDETTFSIIFFSLFALGKLVKKYLSTAFIKITRFILRMSTPIFATSVQNIILILPSRNFCNQSVFVITSKIDKKDLVIFSPLFFSLFSKKVCKYIARAISFSILSTKAIVFSILLMPPIFGNIRKLKSSKPKLIIKAMVYVIFGQSKSF